MRTGSSLMHYFGWVKERNDEKLIGLNSLSADDSLKKMMKYSIINIQFPIFKLAT